MKSKHAALGKFLRLYVAQPNAAQPPVVVAQPPVVVAQPPVVDAGPSNAPSSDDVNVEPASKKAKA